MNNNTLKNDIELEKVKGIWTIKNTIITAFLTSFFSIVCVYFTNKINENNANITQKNKSTSSSSTSEIVKVKTIPTKLFSNNINDIEKKASLKLAKNKDVDEYIEAEGLCLLDLKRFSDRLQAIEMAKICATTVAKANLVEKINGAIIIHNIKLENQSSITTEIESKVEGLIKAVEIVNGYVINDNSVSIKLKVNKIDINSLFK